MRVKSAMNSLGILEVQGLVASIEGLDAMLKAAGGAAYTYGEAARRAACDDCCGGERGGCDSRSRGGRGVCRARLARCTAAKSLRGPHAELLKFFDMDAAEA